MTMEGTSKIGLMAKGMLMGIAEVIPGVSGGTIAFITGIYERLINAIKGVGPNLWVHFKEDGFKGLWKELDGWFLSFLLAGMVIGIGIGVIFISYLLEHYPEPLWAFFFGLIIASAIYIGRKITSWNMLAIVLVIIGFCFAYGITLVSPSEGNTAPWMLFISGAIAISALILPGVSGSFILLLMGMYTIVIPTLKEFLSSPSFEEFKLLFIFGLGALTGLAVFSRVLSWTFKNYYNQTLAILTGFMLGSLNKIWPWRNPSIIMDKESGRIIKDQVLGLLQNPNQLEYKILKELNVMPHDYLLGDPKISVVLIFCLLGFILVFALGKLEK